MNADSYYQPDEPIAEREAISPCDTCEDDTLHLEQKWGGGVATRECLECGDVSDIEGDE